MPEKPESEPQHVDLIRDATRQNARSGDRCVVGPDVKEKRGLSHWPPSHLEQWRADNLNPWRMSRKGRDWD